MKLNYSDQPLPKFRNDLKIYPGPNAEDGSPTYSLQDPVSGTYYQLGWEQALLLELLQPNMTMRELKEAMEKNSTLKLETDELWEFFMYANAHKLLDKKIPGKKIDEEWRKQQMGPLSWIVKNYLYFRIPLIRPDAFLTNTLPIVRLLASAPAKIFYIITSCFGIFLLLGQFDRFLHTFPQFFNWQGAFAYMCMVPIIKVVHEFAHAYVAKAQGITVPTMGIAFMVFHPVAYCDVTDGWKLSQRSKRIWITLAGVLSEIVLAGLSTVGWVFTEPGLLHNIFFIIASTNWITSLLVNLNPVMRFDGYYLLSDLWGIDNLQRRAFEWTRWKLRRVFLGLDFPPPEDFSIRRQFAIFTYTIATWIYRFLLYLGIAIMVYYITNIKPLALFLFGIEMIFFILRPFYLEIITLIHIRKKITFNARLAATTSILLSIFFWALLPFPRSEKIPAIVLSQEEVTVYAPSEEGIISHIHVKRGEQVETGQKLFSLRSPSLDSYIQEYRMQIQILQREITLSEVSEEKKTDSRDYLHRNLQSQRSFLLEKQAELAKAEAELRGFMELQNRNELVASMKGTLYNWEDKLTAGQAVMKQKVLGKIGNLDKKKIMAFVPEKLITHPKVGESASFYSHGLSFIHGKIVKIEKAHTKYLLYPQLASIYKHKAPIEVTIEKNNQLRIIDTFYELELLIDDDQPESKNLRLGQIGTLKIRTGYYSLFFRFIQDAIAIFHRESSF